MLTDSSIRSAIKSALTSGKKSIELKDDGERGAGRLALIIRPPKKKDGVQAQKQKDVISEWYAVAWRDGRRKMTKLGTYPAMPLADARKLFREDFAPAISAGEALPSGSRSRAIAIARAATVEALFEAYVANLQRAGRVSWRIIECALDRAAESIGRTKMAATIEPQHITPLLAEIHSRGAIVMAREMRAYISAAFNFGLKSAHDYTQQDAASTWGLKSNPVAAIPADPEAIRPGNRFLSANEFRTFWLWLETKDDDFVAAPAGRLIMATGQRVSEILCLTKSHYNAAESMLDWSKTKNGQPHTIPLPDAAIKILSALIPDKCGYYFPANRIASRPATSQTLQRLTIQFLAEHPEIEHFTPRDLRRTWKTLAGAAGLSKEIRDRLQNHARNDVSSRHYDRWQMLPEKRAAMLRWNAFLEIMLIGKIAEIA
jgi:integrase